MGVSTTEDMTSTERAVRIALALHAGKRMRVAEVADVAGVSRRHAYKLLNRISLIMPVANEGGYWFLITGDKTGCD